VRHRSTDSASRPHGRLVASLQKLIFWGEASSVLAEVEADQTNQETDVKPTEATARHQRRTDVTKPSGRYELRIGMEQNDAFRLIVEEPFQWKPSIAAIVALKVEATNGFTDMFGVEPDEIEVALTYFEGRVDDDDDEDDDYLS
jgi:hypothetical protein